MDVCIYIYVFLRFHPTCLPIHFLPTLHLHQLEAGLILPDPQTGWLHSLQGPVLKENEISFSKRMKTQDSGNRA